MTDSRPLASSFQDLVIIRLSSEERDSQSISEEHLGRAVSAMHRDGIVVLENSVDCEHIDAINTVLSPGVEELAKLPTTHSNDIASQGEACGNISQSPPLDPALMYDDIWANGPAAAVLACLLGPNPHVNFVNGNTALPGYGGRRQLVHADLTFNHGLFSFGIVTNYYLVDTTPENGSTELWLGSHRDTSFADHRMSEMEVSWPDEPIVGIKTELLEARRKFAPPIQPSVKRGSVVLRDLRLWHAGRGNSSPQPRIMLAFVHTPWWYKCPAKVVLPEEARSLAARWATQKHPVHYHATFLPGPLDHNLVEFNPNFSSANEGYISLLPPNLPRGYIFNDVVK